MRCTALAFLLLWTGRASILGRQPSYFLPDDALRLFNRWPLACSRPPKTHHFLLSPPLPSPPLLPFSRLYLARPPRKAQSRPAANLVNSCKNLCKFLNHKSCGVRFSACTLHPFFPYTSPSFLPSPPFFSSFGIIFHPIAGFFFLMISRVFAGWLYFVIATGYMVNTYVRICARLCYNIVGLIFPLTLGWMPVYVLYI